MSKPIGPEGKLVTVSMAVPAPLKAQIKADAKRLKIPRSILMREAVERGMKAALRVLGRAAA